MLAREPPRERLDQREGLLEVRQIGQRSYVRGPEPDAPAFAFLDRRRRPRRPRREEALHRFDGKQDPAVGLEAIRCIQRRAALEWI